MSADDAIEQTSPVISAQVTPAANAAGWHNTTVPVTFTCADPESGITSCTPPQQVFDEGAGLAVVGTASNGVGLTASVTVTLKMDKTVPLVSVWSPRNGETLSDAATTVTIRGAVTDMSGVASVTCGSVTATVTGTGFTCAVPVSSGSNQLQVQAQDLAGRTTARQLVIEVGGAATARRLGPSESLRRSQILAIRSRRLPPPGGRARDAAI